MSSEFFEAPSLEYLGEHLPQYAFEGFIAQGGMGAVYKARQISLERDVAIKVLPAALGEDADFRESFIREAKAMARLNHPNLIGVFDSGDIEGMPYIVMEFIEGCSLHESAWGQVVDAAQAAAIVKGICDGLAHAHEHGIVHRDIKPANILLTTRAEPKIGDFGVAHTIGSDQSGLVMGTPGYTAPEVFEDPDQAGPLADIYSVGVILHQLITGIDPAGSEGPPTQASGNIRLDAIWRKATRSNPAMRYQSVAEMGAEIQKWFDHRSRASRAAPAVGAGPSSLRSPRGRGIPPVAVHDDSDGSGLLIKIAAIVLLAVAVWFIYDLSRNKKVAIEKIPPAKEATKSLLDPSPVPDPLVPSSPTSSGDMASSPDPAPVSDPAPEPGPSVSVDSPASDLNPFDVAGKEPAGDEPMEDDPASGPTVSDSEGTTGNVADLPPGDPVLYEKAIALILEARKRRDDLMVQNANPLLAFLRDRARGAEYAEAEQLGKVADACASGWLPDPESLPELNPAVTTVYQRAHRDQLAIESSHQVELNRIRDHYVPKLRKAAEETSDEQLKQKLIAQADAATDLAAWVAKLAPEPERQAQALAPANRGFVGKWDVTTDNNTQWIAEESGLLTINSGQWKGKTATWKMLPDGTVEVHWPDKPRPYVLNPNGNGWVGKTSFGQPVTIVPGNW